jgi:hypothetical protein
LIEILRGLGICSATLRNESMQRMRVPRTTASSVDRNPIAGACASTVLCGLSCFIFILCAHSLLLLYLGHLS